MILLLAFFQAQRKSKVLLRCDAYDIDYEGIPL